MYYPSSENKGADQLRGYREADLRLCFRLGRLLVFSRGGSSVIKMLAIMLMFITILSLAAAAVHGNEWEVQTTEKFSKSGDNIKGQETRMDYMEREMELFREVIQTQGNIIQETRQEMEKLKAIVVEQDLKLEKKDKDIEELKLSAQKQDKEMTQLKRRILIMKMSQESLLRKLFPNSEDNSQKSKNQHEMELNLNLPTKDSFEQSVQSDNSSSDADKLASFSVVNAPDIAQNLAIDNFLTDMVEMNTEPNLKSQSDNSKGNIQGRSINTGVAFSAYLSHAVEHMGIGHTIKCDQVLINDGNAYSPFSGTFTVPETAVYFLTFHINAWSSNDETVVRLVVNNRNIVNAVAWVTGTSHHEMAGNSAIIRLNSGEKVWLEIYSNNNVQLYSKPDFRAVTFSGYMVY